MQKSLTLSFVCVVLFAAGLAAANPVPSVWCDWEHGETLFHVEGTGDPAIIATNVTDPDPVHEGTHALRLEDNSPDGTPEAWIAYLYDLDEGDEVTVGFWRYDTTPSVAPSVRIWAHWNNSLPGDLSADDGSAGGDSDYGPGTGWDYAEYTWTVPAGMTGIVIEARTYSNPGDTVWIDELMVMPPGNCTIVTPCLTLVGTQETTFSSLKAEYR